MLDKIVVRMSDLQSAIWSKMTRRQHEKNFGRVNEVKVSKNLVLWELTERDLGWWMRSRRVWEAGREMSLAWTVKRKMNWMMSEAREERSQEGEEEEEEDDEEELVVGEDEDWVKEAPRICETSVQREEGEEEREEDWSSSRSWRKRRERRVTM
jgi:hypothetical protein